MSESDLGEISTAPIGQVEVTNDVMDQSIRCMDCSEFFVWTAGEQRFFLDKNLQNPPKRCKQCKQAKNYRIEAVAKSRTTGKRQPIEVRAQCAKCETVTTVPFYPSQGRPVYCRACFVNMNLKANGANGSS